jgi:hypothetical protein
MVGRELDRAGADADRVVGFLIGRFASSPRKVLGYTD